MVLKHFVGDRKSLNLELKVEATGQDIIDGFTKEIVEMSRDLLVKSVYFFKEKKSFVKLEDFSQCLHQIGAGPDSQFFVFTKPLFSWNPEKCTQGFKFHRENRVAELKAEDLGDKKYHMVMGKNSLNNGVYYWELQLEDCQLLENVMLGVAEQDIEMGCNPAMSKKFWGILPFTGKQMMDDGQVFDLGVTFKKSEKVGFHFEVHKGLG